MADISQIGANIRILREQKGLTQRALADNALFITQKADVQKYHCEASVQTRWIWVA